MSHRAAGKHFGWRGPSTSTNATCTVRSNNRLTCAARSPIIATPPVGACRERPGRGSRRTCLFVDCQPIATLDHSYDDSFVS
ncbi:hypothetical protein I553_1138 [Mycobacterium xenopi 4042]|uniref:Uncharacterized protein n=1 Tax=Mycobacterium xenopi 4042 TaxID=1299334 RepID=X7ZBN3_MYCXE|nr:hypothetical protein I553_1138 [Mycobacterium xenopi 4042]